MKTENQTTASDATPDGFEMGASVLAGALALIGGIAAACGAVYWSDGTLTAIAGVGLISGGVGLVLWGALFAGMAAIVRRLRQIVGYLSRT